MTCSRRPPASNAPPPGALEVRGGLEAHHIVGIAALEAACGSVDGGRLKLEFGVLRERSQDTTDDFLWIDDGTIVGFLGLYQNEPGEVEICGMVHPLRRRTGIFAELLNSAVEEVAQRGAPTVLLIVDRNCEPGVAFAASSRGTLSRSEYRMVQDAPTRSMAADREVSLRPSEVGDYEFVAECVSRSFGEPEAIPVPGVTLLEHVLERAKRAVVIESAGERVGVMTIERLGASAGIYGFAVLPERQGHGIGRAALLKAAASVRADGVDTVHLEVAVDNPRALHLYESCGFDVQGVEDYYALPERAATG